MRTKLKMLSRKVKTLPLRMFYRLMLAPTWVRVPVAILIGVAIGLLFALGLGLVDAGSSPGQYKRPDPQTLVLPMTLLTVMAVAALLGGTIWLKRAIQTRFKRKEEVIQ